MSEMRRICLAVGLVVLAAGMALSVRRRRRIEVCLRIFSITVIITNFVLLMPITGPNVYVVFINALQIGSLDAAYNEWITGTSDAYNVILSVLSAISPILLGGAILSFFENEFNKLRYVLLSPFKNVCYFSELNEESLILARSLKQEGKERGKSFLIVFCNGGGSADRLHLSEAREEGFIIIPESECGKIRRTGRLQYFFEISVDMDMNLTSTKELIDNAVKRGAYSENVKIFLFSSQIEAEIILNATDKHGIEIMLVNDSVSAAYELMYSRPLFQALTAGGNKVVSVLIVGAGNLGREILKAVTWCGQLGGEYALEIRVIDKNAEYLKSAFEKDCPEIMTGEYDILFITADTDTNSFEAALNKHCGNSNYIVVCLGDDERNINAAIDLRGYYLRKSAAFNNEPIINVHVRSDSKSKCVTELTAINRESINRKKMDLQSAKAENYKLNPFGSRNSVYSYGFLLESEIEALALNGNAVYELAFSGGKVTPDDIRRSYFTNEINKRSSRANVIHIKYKLFIMGFYLENKSRTESTASGNSAVLLAEALNNAECLDYLSRLEHTRWMAFQRCEGYRTASVAQAKIFKEQTGSHRQLRSKLHACICSWDELDAVSDAFNPDLKKYDRDFIKCMPEILGLVESPINVSGVSYAVVKQPNELKQLDMWSCKLFTTG